MTIIDFVRPKTATVPYLPFGLLPLAMAVALAVVGAFGSYVVMTLPIRLLHFSATSLAIGTLAFILTRSLRRYMFAGAFPCWATVLVAMLTAPLGGLIIQQSLGLFAPHALRHVSFSELTGQVLLINLVIGTLTWALLRQTAADASDKSKDKSKTAQPVRADDALGDLRAKLPFALQRAPIVALSAEDHYVRVRTDRGQALILMNLATAIDALGPTAGVRIHRSHWVSRALAADTAGGRHGIKIDDTTVLPISRAGRKLLNELRGSLAQS